MLSKEFAIFIIEIEDFLISKMNGERKFTMINKTRSFLSYFRDIPLLNHVTIKRQLFSVDLLIFIIESILHENFLHSKFT